MKKILFIVFALIVIGAIALGYKKYGYRTEEDLIKAEAWAVLEDYLRATKEHDIERVKELSYQVSDVCLDKTRESECFGRMNDVYYFGSLMNKKDFTNVWHDSKQIILLSDVVRADNEEIIQFSRGIIYFVIDTTGKIKLLKFNDSKGVSMSKEGRTVEEIDAYLQKRMLDEDQDGIEDEVEQCLKGDATCVKTDPKNRDTDGDGFWDGIQASFYKT